MTKLIPRDYQDKIANEAADILRDYGIVYLSMQVRTGKTITGLLAAQRCGATKILFLTVKKAIGGIKKDIDLFPDLNVEILSIDSAHKAKEKYDLVIVDEAHGIGAFPKPNRRAKAIQKVAYNLPIILMSGTPNPESLSQLYHQFWISSSSPWKVESSFYKWARSGYVDIKQKFFNGRPSNDYSNGVRSKIQPTIDKLFISFSQVEAGFKCDVKEHVRIVEMNQDTVEIVKKIKKDKLVYLGNDVILADTAVKMMQKVHQLGSGTVITEAGDRLVIDNTKAAFIYSYFKTGKIAIYYKYTAELQMLKEFYGDTLTEDIEEFNTTDKNIALQIRAGSMGINLSAADCQVFLNIDFSSKDYIQARARLQTQDRESVNVYFIFGNAGIESDIYKLLQKKEDFTARYFKPLF